MSDQDTEPEHDHRATYCPEDNKLRFYPDWSDPEFDKEDMKAAGYRWASKQECYVCPRWTTRAEDAALAFVGDIEDENYGPAERAADRAERFAEYRDKRRDDAHSAADRMGDAVLGFQSEAKANRAARKRDRLRGRSLTMWDRAEYWQMRTAGVIRHAIGREDSATRRTRIKKLEAEQRKQLADLAKRAEWLKAWGKVASWNGPEADELLPLVESGFGITDEATEPGRLAYELANRGDRCRAILPHPRDENANEYAARLHGEHHRGFTPYDLLTDTHYGHGEERREFDRLTPREVARLYLEHAGDPTDEADIGRRWANHYENRLNFERAMLGEEGGAADDLEIVAGGFLLLRGEMGRWLAEEAPEGWAQIHKVHKSRATGKASSVEVMGILNRHCATETKPGLVKINIERFAADRYRAPTTDELAAFEEEQKKAKAAKRKAAKEGPPKPKLINPTPEDAAKLQTMLNALERREGDHREPINSTQAAYSSQSKGEYANGQTMLIGEKGRPLRNYHSQSASWQRHAIFKVRTYTGGGGARRVVILTDKPQKPLPFDAIEKARAEEPTEETHGAAFVDYMDNRDPNAYVEDEAERERLGALRLDFGYLGWADISCAGRCSVTDLGREVLDRWRTTQTETPDPVWGLLKHQWDHLNKRRPHGGTLRSQIEGYLSVGCCVDDDCQLVYPDGTVAMKAVRLTATGAQFATAEADRRRKGDASPVQLDLLGVVAE